MTTSARFKLKFFSLILEKYSDWKALLYYFSPEKSVQLFFFIGEGLNLSRSQNN